jgi:alpha-ketoglutarate-dependent taurine dioxygenase
MWGTYDQFLDTNALHPSFGVEVRGVDLAEQLPPADELLDLLDQHGFLLFRRQCLHDDQLHAFSSSLCHFPSPAPACSPPPISSTHHHYRTFRTVQSV